MSNYAYPFDPSASMASNRILNEVHTINPAAYRNFRLIVPSAAPFFEKDLVVRHYPSGNILVKGQDYFLTHKFLEASHSIGIPVYGSISFYNTNMIGACATDYRTLGGEWVIDEATAIEIVGNSVLNPRVTSWSQVVDIPAAFPPINHDWPLDDLVGARELEQALIGVSEAVTQGQGGGLAGHINDKNNPHAVTKAQVQLGNVPNWGVPTQTQANEGTLSNLFMSPLTTRQALLSHLSATGISGHVGITEGNPHGTTKFHVQLGNVPNLSMANQAQAEAGGSNDYFMSPLRTSQLIAVQVGNAFAAHAGERNPHGTTKEDVHLGNVPNNPMADEAQAVSATPTNQAFMSPLRTDQRISMRLQAYSNVPNWGAAQPNDLATLATDKVVSPANVKTMIDQHGGGSSGNVLVAEDSNRLGGLTLTQVIETVGTGLDASSAVDQSTPAVQYGEIIHVDLTPSLIDYSGNPPARPACVQALFDTVPAFMEAELAQSIGSQFYVQGSVDDRWGILGAEVPSFSEKVYLEFADFTSYGSGGVVEAGLVAVAGTQKVIRVAQNAAGDTWGIYLGDESTPVAGPWDASYTTPVLGQGVAAVGVDGTTGEVEFWTHNGTVMVKHTLPALFADFFPGQAFKLYGLVSGTQGTGRIVTDEYYFHHAYIGEDLCGNTIVAGSLPGPGEPTYETLDVNNTSVVVELDGDDEERSLSLLRVRAYRYDAGVPEVTVMAKELLGENPVDFGYTFDSGTNRLTIWAKTLNDTSMVKTSIFTGSGVGVSDSVFTDVEPANYVPGQYTRRITDSQVTGFTEVSGAPVAVTNGDTIQESLEKLQGAITHILGQL